MSTPSHSLGIELILTPDLHSRGQVRYVISACASGTDTYSGLRISFDVFAKG